MKAVRELILIPLVIAGFGLASPSLGQSAAPSRERQADCQKQAAEKGLRSGPERRDFMRQCVHGTATPTAAKAAPAAEPAKPATPAEPAKPAMAKEPAKVSAPPPNLKDECRKQADEKSLRGGERRDFMRSCMRPK